MINIKNLLKRYNRHTALDHIHLHVDKGVVLGLLGPNGAGKTTLLSILNGLTDYEEGEIEIFGLPLQSEQTAIRRRSSFIPQSLALYENLTVIENLNFFAAIQKITGSALRRNIDYAVTGNRLQPMLKQKAGTLSGGQRRRLNIAIGLLNDPELLYFDEAAAGLDPAVRNDILDTILSLKDDGKTIIYTSHYIPEIEKICDEIAVIHHGRIIRRGKLAKILEEEKNNSIRIEVLHSKSNQLANAARQIDALKIINDSTMILPSENRAQLGRLLDILEGQNIEVQHIHFDAPNLETIFLRLTSQEADDV